MEIEELKYIISSIYPFNKLKEDNLKSLINISGVREYKNGEVIYKEGAESDHLYILIKGRVAVSAFKDNRDSEIDVLKRGTCFGIISLFTDEPHSVTARSIENSYILQIEKEEFKDFLENNPLISLDLSRILSQRVKVRSKPKTIFQSKKIGIVKSDAIGKMTYAEDLALELKRQTKKNVILIHMAADSENDNVLSTKDFHEEHIDKHIVKGEIDSLYVDLDVQDNFFSLLNFISESYHFIIYEIPYKNLDDDSSDLTSPLHQLHFIINSNIADLHKEAQRIQNLRIRTLLGEEKIKIILLESAPKDKINFEDKQKLLKTSVYATLFVHSSKDYCGALQRIAREIGEVVLGIALGSGAAYGFSHIGVLKVLEQEKVHIDVICGTSMGSVVAALWAVGFSFPDIERLCKEIGRKLGSFSIFGLSFPFKGVMKARRLENIFKDVFGDLTFYDLKHTLKVIAFDFVERNTVILTKGLLYKALAASCAFPGIFEPVGFKKNILLDGGVLSPLPTKVLVGSNVNKIIASNITLSREQAYQQYKKRNKLGIFDFIFGSIETMQQEFIEQALKLADVVVHPNLEGLGWTEFNKVPEFIRRGEEAALEKIKEIKTLIST